MKPGIGGHIFVRNAIEFDFCLVEAINSMLPFCEEVLVMDCSSTDGTKEMLSDIFGSNRKVILWLDQPWELATGQGGLRLRLQAEKCRQRIAEMGYAWQFMLQADEVVHETSYPHILSAARKGRREAYIARRIDMMYNMDLCMWADVNRYPSNLRPMDPDVCRLARSFRKVVADASDLERHNVDMSTMENIVMFHYSMVRDRKKIIDKIITMHQWYHGQDPWDNPDNRVCDMKRRGVDYDPRPWKTQNGFAQSPCRTRKWRVTGLRKDDHSICPPNH